MQQIEELLAGLNPTQRQASLAIEGPVQVIAGPGTGKTQILASRIANILAKTDTDPWNILCLTFTEAGVVAMRKRLLLFIGPAAHQVQIHTFHSLCNQIIQDNQSLFGASNLAPIDDIESELLMRSICERIEAETPLYNNFDPYSNKYALFQAFQTFKKENLKGPEIKTRVLALLQDLKTDENLIYKRNGKGFKKGDLNPNKYAKAKKPLDKLLQSADLFEIYLKKMNDIQRYDFNDMILWVIKALETNQELLLNYQEQFQYLLTDEFQDTNGAQLKLIELLMNHWESPNIFSVGDDDQSIFAFQGANVANMIKFGEQFNNGLQEFVLNINYRSSPEILTASAALISHNQERLINVRTHLSKELIAHHPAHQKPMVIECKNPLAEATWVANQIQDLQNSGADLKDIAVIYNKHKQCEQLSKVLQAQKTAINLHKTDNIFENEVVTFLVGILKYIGAELDQPFTGEKYLFKLLHANFFKIPSLLLAEKALEMSRKRGMDKIWRRGLQKEEATLFETAPIRQAMQTIEGWISYAANHSPVRLLDKIILETQLLSYYKKPGKNNMEIAALVTFFGFLRDRNEKNKAYDLDKFLEEITLLQSSNGLSVVNAIKTENGVNFLTAHGSKGLEFKYVFVLANTADHWDKNTRDSGISLRPLFGKQQDDDAAEEEKRRLLFVAMTRAEKELYLTFYNEKADGKDTSESKFISELLASGTVLLAKANTEEEDLKQNSLLLLANQTINLAMPDHAYLQKYLDNYVLSATHLNSYLKCPLAFYYEKILRVPGAKPEAVCVGNAVHETLNIYFKSFKEKGVLPDNQLLTNTLEWKMNEQYIYFNPSTFDQKLENTKSFLLAYANHKKAEWQNEEVFLTEKNLEAMVGNAKIKGFLDKMVFNGSKVHVVDFKTGNPAIGRVKTKAPEMNYDGDDLTKKYGGEYWRQIIFYHFLVNGDKRYAWQMESGAVSCVEKDREKGIILEDIVVQPDEWGLSMVKSLIENTYAQIKAAEFTEGCGKTNEYRAADNCEWCGFHAARQGK